MKNDHLNEPDHLERVLRGITDPEALIELNCYMVDIALNLYRDLIQDLPANEAVSRMDELTETVKRISDENTEANIRRWLIEKRIPVMSPSNEWAIAAKGMIVTVNTGYVELMYRLETLHREACPEALVVCPTTTYLTQRDFTVTGAVVLANSQLYPVVEEAVIRVLAGGQGAVELMRSLESTDAEIWWLAPEGPFWCLDRSGEKWAQISSGAPYAFLGPVPEAVRRAVIHCCHHHPGMTLDEILARLETLGLLSEYRTRSPINQIANYTEPQ